MRGLKCIKITSVEDGSFLEYGQGQVYVRENSQKERCNAGPESGRDFWEAVRHH